MGIFLDIILALICIICGILFITDPRGVLKRREKRKYGKPRAMAFRGIALIILGLFFVILAIIKT
jgi:uncharacterized membrane protein HdeD (DUF308 family)